MSPFSEKNKYHYYHQFKELGAVLCPDALRGVKVVGGNDVTV